jgi:hypothetical protein
MRGWVTQPDLGAWWLERETKEEFVLLRTIDGGEVQDDSTDSNNPQMQVSCDGTSIFGPSGTHRFTDLLGTRIQGQMGPNPALLLPRGALHTGAEHDTSGSHYSQSMLELRGEDGPSRAYGKCFIWTGAP